MHPSSKRPVRIIHKRSLLGIWYGDGAGNTTKEVSPPQSECTSYRQQGHAGNKILLQQNPPVLNSGACRLTQVVLYNDHKTAVVVQCSSSICGGGESTRSNGSFSEGFGVAGYTDSQHQSSNNVCLSNDQLKKREGAKGKERKGRVFI